MDTPTPNVHERNAQWKHEWDRLHAELVEAEAADERVRARRCRREMDRIQAEFFKANSGLAHDAARVFLTQASRGNHDDYVQAANVGLLKAWPMWDPSKGTFGTFSRAYAEGEVNRTVRSYEHAHISYGDHTAAPHVRNAENALKEELGRVATDKEVAERAQLSVGIVQRVRSKRPLSLDAPMGSGDDDSQGMTIADKAISLPGTLTVDLGTLTEEEELSVLEALGKLTPLQAAVTARRYGLDGAPAQTLAEIADLIDGSRESMRRIDDAAEDLLKHVLG